MSDGNKHSEKIFNSMEDLEKEASNVEVTLDIYKLAEEHDIDCENEWSVWGSCQYETAADFYDLMIGLEEKYGREKALELIGYKDLKLKPLSVENAIERWIDSFTNPNATILDPFTGGGTVPAVCKMLHRNYLAFEIDPATADMARKRVAETQPPLPIVYHEQMELIT